MMARDQWITMRAKEIYEKRMKEPISCPCCGYKGDSLSDWLQAESEWNSYHRHDLIFHELCDIRG